MNGPSERSGRPEAPPPSKPPVVAAVLDAAESETDDGAAWEAFLDRYSRLLLHVAARAAKSYDERMNLYAHIVGELRRDGYRRLRAYSPTAAAQFTTWLGVVARRLCLDYKRHRYGRWSGHDGDGARRRLEDLVYEELDPSLVVDHRSPAPDVELARAELLRHLAGVLDGLEPRERLMLTLHFVDGRSAREIADALHCTSQWHVYRRIESTLDTLRRELAARGIREAAP